MAIEIERKFLVAGKGWRQAVSVSRPMRQGYLDGGDNCSIRVRVDGERALLNIKSAEAGASRMEFEYPIPLTDAQQMLERLCVGQLVEKTRHYVLHQGHTWEVDEFHGTNDGLVVAELELESENALFEIPGWLGQEVTDDLRYYNNQLAQTPYSQWSTS